MPRVSRSATMPAPQDRVWEIVSDPDSLPRWWPGVERVEEAWPHAWTKVFRSKRGKTVRADYARRDEDPGSAREWELEVAGSPFERFVREEVTRISLASAEGDATRVEIRINRKLRGLSSLGGVMMRGALRRQLDEALDGLRQIVPPDADASR